MDKRKFFLKKHCNFITNHYHTIYSVKLYKTTLFSIYIMQFNSLRGILNDN